MGGYVAPQAVTRIEFASVAETETALQTIQTALRERGFELQPSSPFPEQFTRDWTVSMKWSDQHQVSLTRQQTDGTDFIVYLTPFPAAETFADAPPQEHFPILQLRFVELRPGGFSPEGHRNYAEFMTALRAENYRMIVVSEPPPTDDAEYKRVTYGGMASLVFWWLVSWLFGITTIGALVNWLLLRGGVKLGPRRFALVAPSGSFW